MRIDLTEEKVVEAARQTMRSAATVVQLRECLAILIPVLTGASLDTTALVLGVSRSGLRELRRDFLDGTAQHRKPGTKRGGRRRALMSVEEERLFVEPWMERDRRGVAIDVPAFRAAYERAVGQVVAKSTIYRLLVRHGWQKEGNVSAEERPRV